MFLAAVAHIYSFPHWPFHINAPLYWSNPNRNWCRAFLSMIDMSDVQEDVTEHLGVVTSSISRRFQGRGTYQPLSRGTRRTSVESDYLISKRQDNVPLTVAVDMGTTTITSSIAGNNLNSNIIETTTTATTGTGNKRKSMHTISNYYNTANNKNNHNSSKFNVTNKNTFTANAKNYGATDNNSNNRILLPYCDNDKNLENITYPHPNPSPYSNCNPNSNPNLKAYDAYMHENPTTSKNITCNASRTTARTSTEPHYKYYSAGQEQQQLQQQQHEEQTLHVPSNAATNSISIQQKRERATAINDDDDDNSDKDCIFTSQYVAPMARVTGNSFLDTRQGFRNTVDVDVDDDLATLLGGNINRR